MSGSNDLRDTFFLECEDLLEEMSEGLRGLEPGASNIDVVNMVFRSVHSIKGGAGAFKLTELVEFAHCFETLLDELRAESLQLNDDMLSVMHRAGDHLNDMVVVERDGFQQDTEKTGKLKSELEAFLPEGTDNGADEAVAAFVPMALSIEPIGTPSLPADETFEIVFCPKDDLYKNGNEPALLVRELADLGEVSTTVDLSSLPDLSSLEVGKSYLSWTFELVTDQGLGAIKEVFEFVETTADLDIRLKEQAPQETATGEVQAPEADLPDIAPIPNSTTSPDTSAASILEGMTNVEAASDDATAKKKPPEPAPQKPDQSARAASQPRPTIRVDLERVDRLINIVGELIIHQAMLTQAVEQAELTAGSEISSALDELKQLSRDIQDSVMAIRAQPVKPLFQRMHRIVREAQEAAGKKVKLVTEGEATEVDKTVVEKLADPLTHMVRNAVDHGLESNADRVQAGKPEVGTVTLSAGHRSGRVLITIKDDGAGINRERVLAKAIEKGLVAPDAELSDQDIDNLLFLPGFSTAAEISSLSGRGVGMDVVRSAIQALGGKVTITSTQGVGTVFSISLPLTLAVLDGMVVDVAEQQMVVPITTIVETLRPRKEEVMALGPNKFVIAIRGSYIPIVDVGYVLGYRDQLEQVEGLVALLVETEDENRAAFIVDSIRDQRQVVIKSLQENYGDVAGVAAATVFGDGRVALIVDPGDLIEESAKMTTETPAQIFEMEVRHGHAN